MIVSLFDVVSWAPVPAFPNYEVSSLGHVMSKRTKKLRTPFTTPNGYKGVHLYAGGRKNYKVFSVQSLVAALFLGPRPEGRVIHHKDGNKQNNNVDNLEYVTQSYNVTVDIPRGEKHWNAKLTEEDVKEIRASKESSYKTALHFPIGPSTIRSIRRGELWAS